MPFYIFQHPDTGEQVEVSQRIKDPHIYSDKEGLQWQRVFTAPHTSVPLGVNPNSADDFVRRTRDMQGTVGDMWDLSRDMSEKRKQERGEGGDPVQNKYYKDYSRKRKGLKHDNDPSKNRSLEI